MICAISMLWRAPSAFALILLALSAGGASGLTQGDASSKAPPKRHVQHKHPPPECSAITFSALSEAGTDGVREAAFYKAQMGRLELMAEFKQGMIRNYFINLPDTPLAVGIPPFPPNVIACLKAKAVSLALDQDECIGTRLKIVISSAGTARYLLLYAMRESRWRYCRTVTTPATGSQPPSTLPGAG